MTPDDVIRMVRETADKTTVDPVHGDPPLIVVSPDEMIRFAKLAQAAEREACAKVCERHADPSAGIFAAAIRARGET